MTNSGYKQELYWGDESAYGTGATINQPFGLVQSVNPTETNTLIKVRTMGGTRDYNNIVAGKFEVSGNVEYYLQGGAFIRQAMGEDTATTTTVDSGPKIHSGASYLHVMGSAASPTADSFPSFEMEFTDEEDTGAAANTANLKRRYRGCRVNALTISGNVDEPVKVNADWIGRHVVISTAAAAAVTQSTDDPYVFYQGAVYATTGAISAYTAIGTSSEIAEVNSFDFSVNNNLEAVWYVSGTTATQQIKRGVKVLIPKGRDYAANLNLHFKNRAMYQKFLGATDATIPQDTLAKYQIVLDLIRSGTLGGVKAATDDYMRIMLASCAFDTINIPGSPEDIVNETIGVDVKSAKVYVIDDDASYK